MAEPRITVALAAAPLFAGLPPHHISRVAEFCHYNGYRKGNTVFIEGDRAASFYVVASGQIKVYKGSSEGREVIIKVMRKGDLVGEAAALMGRPYPASAQALTDAAAVEVPRREFVELIKKEPSLALNMVAALSERLQQLGATLEKLTLKEVPSRLASYLLDHARADAGGAAVVEFQIPKAALAAELGTVPETLSRALRKFADAGFIVLEEGRVTLTDERSLRLLAEGPRS